MFCWWSWGRGFFFRIETLPEALAFLGVMAGVGEGQAPPHLTIDLFTMEHRLLFTAAVLSCVSWQPLAGLFTLLAARFRTRFWQTTRLQAPVWLSAGGQLLNVVVLMSILILSIMHIAVGTYNPFIYFRF